MSLERSNHHSRKFPSYYKYYDAHFLPWKEKELKLLEIGIQFGGSLEMWSNFFPKAQIMGIDIDPVCKIHQRDRVQVKIGSQTDIKFLSQFTGYDIIIDDGGHTMKQQQLSFQTLFPLLNPGGLYVIEDLHTSYWPEFFDIKMTTMEYLASLTHSLNAEASKSPRAKSLNSIEDIGIEEMHFYPSMCFIKKQTHAKVLASNPREEGGWKFKFHKFLKKLK